MMLALVWQGLVVGALIAIAAVGIEGIGNLGRRPVRWGWLVALVLTIGLIAVAPFRTQPMDASIRPSGPIGVSLVAEPLASPRRTVTPAAFSERHMTAVDVVRADV